MKSYATGETKFCFKKKLLLLHCKVCTYLIIMSLTVSQSLPFIITMTIKWLFTLGTHKVLLKTMIKT